MSITSDDTDRIEKHIVIRAPRSRVWRAITDAEQFGAWFGAKVEGPFVAGAQIRGDITHPGYEHLKMEFTVDRVEPEHLFSVRWHPYSIDPDVDYSSEPTTLVEFRLADVDGGTALTVTESGFDRVPAARRAEAYRMNDQGWGIQVHNVERYVAGS